MKARLLILLALVVSCLPTVAVGQPHNDEPLEMNDPKWGGYFGLFVGGGKSGHAQIEDDLSRFQEDTGLSAHITLGLLGSVRRYNNILELEWSGMAGGDLEFMDEDHNFTVNEMALALWYRRRFELMRRIRALPGAGVGYSWGSAAISYHGEEETSQSTRSVILEGSSPMVAVGVVVDLRVHEWNDGVLFVGWDYHYRFDIRADADIQSDGDIFFGDGSEFDFSGHYFGLVVRMGR